MRLPIMPVNSVTYPWMPVVLSIFEDRYRRMLRDVLAGPRFFGTALIAEGKEVGGPAVPHPVGVEVMVVKAWPTDSGSWRVIGVGRRRFRVAGPVAEAPYPAVEVDYEGFPEDEADVPAELGARVRSLFSQHLRMLAELLGSPTAGMEIPEHAARLSYMVAAHLGVDLVVRQRLLAMVSARERLEAELKLLADDLARFRVFVAARPFDPGKADLN